MGIRSALWQLLVGLFVVLLPLPGHAESLPPRSVNDVLRLLDHYRPDPELAARRRAQVAEAPPEGASPQVLAEFYLQRGRVAGQIGLVNQQIEDMRRAVALADRRTEVAWRALRELSGAEANGGNLLNALKASEQAAVDIPDHRIGLVGGAVRQAVAQSAVLGDFEGARRHLARLERLTRQAENEGLRQRFGYDWSEELERARGDLARGEGRYADAAAAYRRAWLANDKNIVADAARVAAGRGAPLEREDGKPSAREAIENWLGLVLLEQGKLVDAEMMVRQALRHALERLGRSSVEVGLSLELLARIVAEQGRDAEALRLTQEALVSYQQAGAATESFRVASVRRALGAALVALGDYPKALEIFRQRRSALASDPQLLKRLGAGDLDWALAMLRSGQREEAQTMVSAMLATASERFGDEAARTAEVRAMLGMILAESGQPQEARRAFERALPILIDRARSDSEASTGTVRRQRRLTLMIESYLHLLGDVLPTLETTAAAAVIADSFRMADVARGSNVQRALTASAARAVIRDPQLAELARREQEAQRRISTLTNLLAQLLAAPPEQQLPKIQAEMQADIRQLETERAGLKKEILRRFPDYAQLVDPQPATLEQLVKVMQPGEALVAWYFGEQGSWVWAAGFDRATGAPRYAFRPLTLTRAQMAAQVRTLRKALDPGVAMIQDVPPFDQRTAYALYRQILQPVEAVWGEAEHLLLVPHAELGQLPLAVLTTQEKSGTEASPAKDKVTFAEYRNTPWLIRRAGLTQLPSVTSLVSLRLLARQLPAQDQRQGFIGFGDPLFSRDQAREAGLATRPGATLASRGRTLALRNMPQLAGVDSAQLGLLPRLPDTGEEILSIGAVLGAQAERDMFLRERATEAMATGGQLNDRRVVMFATHGLIPGDLNGLQQPALALTSPEVSPEGGEGLLTMDKVLALKMNADWVVLSACNTAAGDGAGAEAVSGLGRAFFYAGARALLVSNWPVETVAARLLMTELFRRQQADKKLRKAEALRQSMLTLIDSGGAPEPGGKRLFYSYAHPLFWAPFVVVGD